ncbi:MAG TPA: hypothetical protein VKP65_14655 [Rhodothermales bacterium]|nr:hypothetical protein [Rhodothermales bacterium]
MEKRTNVRTLFVPILLLGLLMGLAADVQAQDALVPARVTYLAGQNLYLDAGRDVGVMPDDTLSVYRDGALIGRLVVVSSISDRSVVTFSGEPFPVTLGTTLQLRTPGTPVPPELEAEPIPELEPVEEQPAVVEEEPVSPHEEPKPTRSSRAEKTRVAGRVMLSMNALQSSTQWQTNGGGSSQRTFVTPSLNLHLTISDLPQDLRVRTRLRGDYRYSSGRPIDPAFSFRAYELVVEKAFTGFDVQAGRFSNRYATGDGYWDGVLIHVGDRKTGIGTALGFMPDRSNEGFSAEMPRYGGFAHIEVGDRSSVTYEVEAAYNEIRPTNDLLNHRFASLSHRVRWQGLSLRNDVQVDRNPISSEWVASRITVRGAWVPATGITLHGRYRVRQPYSIYRTQSILSFRRDQIGAGTSLRLGPVVLGGDAAVNFVEDNRSGRERDGQTVSGYLQVPRTGVLDLGFSSNSSYWSDDDGSSFFLTTGLTRSFGDARLRVQYQFYRTATANLPDPLVSNTVALHATLPLGGGLYTSSQVRLQRSSTLSSASLYTSLWLSF